jgi:hypothetical protein
MRRFLRRQADDRYLKLIARADQRKFELNRNVTATRGDDQRLRDRASRGSRLDATIVAHPSRATPFPRWAYSSLRSKRSASSS